MDEQHKQLVALINALHTNKGKADTAFVERIINTLIQYTLNHFRDEERLMKKIGFSECEKHKLMHQSFIEAIIEAKKDFDKYKNSVEVIDKLLEFLRNWLLHHILVQDRAYGKYIEE